jgi:UDP-glucuronate decarboxylase
MRAEGVYGRVIPRFIEQALSNKPFTIFGAGTQTRSFCYVSDQVEGLLTLALSEGAKGEVVNIGGNKEITISELAKLIRELTNSSSEIEFLPLPKDDPQRRKPDITKAKKLLHWEPKVELKEGLSKMINWFKEKEGG